MLVSAPSPCDMILYHDEVTPGNILTHDNRRKVKVIYMASTLDPLVHVRDTGVDYSTVWIQSDCSILDKGRADLVRGTRPARKPGPVLSLFIWSLQRRMMRNGL